MTSIQKAKLDPAFAKSWISAAVAGRMDALVSLLLVQLQHLEKLVLETSFAREMSFIGQAILCKCLYKDSTPVWQQLRTIEISVLVDLNTSPVTIDNTDAVLAMFYLPNFQHIQADIGIPPRMLKWPGQQEPNPVMLTSLNLYTIREPHLGEILRVTRNLKTLHWFWNYSPDMLNCSPVLDLNAISAALQHVQATLTDLHIDADTDEGVNGIEFQAVHFHGAMDGLCNMRVLERLHLPFVFLLGAPEPKSPEPNSNARHLEGMLPRTLRHLNITQELGMWPVPVNKHLAWDDEDQYEKIAAWLRNAKAGAAPLLRSLRFEFGTWSPVDFNLWPVPMQERLISIGAEVGVDVEII